jgi:hypothetical protein
MRTLSGPIFDLATFMPALSDDQSVALQRSVGVQHGRHKMIVGFYLVSAPVATIAWVAGLARATIWLVEFVLF